jgi:hypothetical protein
MTARYQSQILTARDEIVAPPAPRACQDHSFEMPTAVYGAVGALLFGFMAVMAIGFAHPELVVPMAINFIFLTAFFTVPVIFVTGSPKDVGPKSMRWSEFIRQGLDTATGHTSGSEAIILTLMLPFFIFCWGIAVLVVAALV